MAFDAASFMQRYLAGQIPAPSRRQNSARSGRTNNRQTHTRRDLAKVGGKVSWVSAVYNGNDRATAETSDPVDMCVVVEREVKATSEPRDAPLVPYNPTGAYSYVGRVGCV